LEPDFRAQRDGRGSGLRGMRERAQLLGGDLHAGVDPDGWQVEMSFPVGESNRLTDRDANSGGDKGSCGLSGSWRTAGMDAP